jgi:hypothetical protein
MKVFDVKDEFAFDKISLASPQPVQGGTYFTKLKMDGEPLYIQMPKCLTKQGIVKTKKGKYSDLMYERHDEENLIEWIENLELRCQDLINDKKDVWFHTELSKDDITSMMTPICRMYKSGKNILIRVTIETCRQTNKDKCIAYSEDEVLVDLDKLEEDQSTIPLLCIEGIKFTSRSFEIHIILKQLMFLSKRESIEQTQTCLIKHNYNQDIPMISTVAHEPVLHEPVLHEPVLHEPVLHEPIAHEPVVEKQVSHEPVAHEPVVEKQVSHESVAHEPIVEKQVSHESVAHEPVAHEPVAHESVAHEPIVEKQVSHEHVVEKQESHEPVAHEPVIVKQHKIIETSTTEGSNNINMRVKNTLPMAMEEVKVDVSNDKEAINLKQPNEIYYEIYKAAKKKAKHMRKVALDSYLEAEKLRVKFSLEDLDGSDDSDDSDDSKYYSDSSDNESNIDTSHLNLAEN